MATRRGFQRNLRDNDLRVTRALPGAASTTVRSTVIDLGTLTAFAERPEGVELVAVLPALNTTQLPDTKTTTFTIEVSDDSAFGSGVDVLATVVFTGAGGAGAVTAELRAGITHNTKRYASLKAVTGAATGDQSAASAEFCVVI